MKSYESKLIFSFFPNRISYRECFCTKLLSGWWQEPLLIGHNNCWTERCGTASTNRPSFAEAKIRKLHEMPAVKGNTPQPCTWPAVTYLHLCFRRLVKGQGCWWRQHALWSESVTRSGSKTVIPWWRPWAPQFPHNLLLLSFPFSCFD